MIQHGLQFLPKSYHKKLLETVLNYLVWNEQGEVNLEMRSLLIQ